MLGNNRQDRDEPADVEHSRRRRLVRRALARLDEPMIDSSFALSRTGTRSSPSERRLEAAGDERIEDARQ
ncbi:hypothetical protein [Halococcus sediminicola]|uniref:hypothetical protein n=1 Tax=Halococcus sediminicola TaxID=1264579 RepID=UPI000678CC72|nr:hypothetical protein [Halococcus sediminicola]